MEVLQTVTTHEEQKCQVGFVIKARTNHFSPAALTIGPGFPLPTTLFAVAGKTSPGPSSYHLQGNSPSSCPEQLCAQNKTQPLLSRSTAWHCPKQPLSSHLPTWSSQLALKVSTPWHLHRSCNNLLFAEGYITPSLFLQNSLWGSPRTFTDEMHLTQQPAPALLFG